MTDPNPHGCTIGGQPAMPILISEYNQLTANLAAGEQQKQRADQDEAAIARVIDLYEQWVKAGPPPLGTSVSRWWDTRLAELHNAIRPPADQTATEATDGQEQR